MAVERFEITRREPYADGKVFEDSDHSLVSRQFIEIRGSGCCFGRRWCLVFSTTEDGHETGG